MDINWFPGHMTKARRMIEQDIKLIDVVIELLDARIPHSSANPLLYELSSHKARVVVLNKSDLAEPRMTELWLRHFTAQGICAVAADSAGGQGVKNIAKQVEKAASGKVAKLMAKGIREYSVRTMILGIPNVGKSSLINRLASSAMLKTADKPGVTRGKQWIKINKNLDLLDTPGVLWPKLDSADTAFKLAATGAINDDVYDVEKVVLHLVALLRDQYAERLISRFKIDVAPDQNAEEILEQVAKRRGCLRSGGIIDREKAVRLILSEFRTGKLGVFTLDAPDEPEKDKGNISIDTKKD